MSTIDDLREKVYRIRTLMHLYEESLSKSASESENEIANRELKITKDELLKLIIETRKGANQLASASAREYS